MEAKQSSLIVGIDFWFERERERERESEKQSMESSTTSDSQQIVSDDDEIDYSVKPEFYDPGMDEKDESWVHKKRRGRTSDAVLSCPACFTTLSLECQRHEKYLTQYRAIFVMNCKVKSDQILHERNQRPKNGKTGKRRSGESDEVMTPSGDDSGGETFRPVCCLVCSTEVGVMDEEEIYHFFNVLPSY